MANILEQAEELKKRLDREKAFWMGRTVTLYDLDLYVAEAYKDQYGIPHSAAVVKKQVDVVVVDTAQMDGSWSDSVMLIVIGADKKGNQYKRIPDELSGSVYWRDNESHLWREHLRGLTILPNGKRVDKP